jgi:hypothetical protein
VTANRRAALCGRISPGPLARPAHYLFNVLSGQLSSANGDACAFDIGHRERVPERRRIVVELIGCRTGTAMDVCRAGKEFDMTASGFSEVTVGIGW